MSLDRFLDFKNNKFVFVSPMLWSDPYEKAYLEAKYNFDGTEYRYPLKPAKGFKFYAQCWTATKQLEAMWKGFADNEDGVLIKMSVEKIIEILEDFSFNSPYDFYIGKVKYENAYSLYDMKANFEVWQEISEQKISNRVISLMLKKREPFSFENEFRIMAIRRDDDVSDKSVLILKYENLLPSVEYLKFDPRMGENLFSFIKSALNTEYPELNIHQSKLYSNPVKTLGYLGRQPQDINDEIIFPTI